MSWNFRTIKINELFILLIVTTTYRITFIFGTAYTTFSYCSVDQCLYGNTHGFDLIDHRTDGPRHKKFVNRIPGH